MAVCGGRYKDRRVRPRRVTQHRPPLPQCATDPTPATGQWEGAGRTPPQPPPIGARCSALGPAHLPPRPVSPAPAEPRKKSKRHRSGTKWRPRRTRLRHRPRRGPHGAEPSGDNAGRAPAGRLGTQQERPAPHTLCCASPALAVRGSPQRFYEPGLWVSVQVEPNGFSLRCGRRRRSEAGRTRPARATDGSDCCATRAVHREMEAAPRVSAAPRGHWRRRRPRPSSGIPGRGRGRAGAPQLAAMMGRPAGKQGRESCAEG